MSEDSKLREEICLFGKSMFDRGLTSGSSGNISARLSDGSLLVTPTGRALGLLDPAQISHLDRDGQLISGDPPTKETPLHTAFYETRARTGAVVHLHSSYAVVLSMLPGLDPENVLVPLTPYPIMRLGRVKLLPFYLPGDPGMGDAIRALDGKRTAVLFANHGPVVAGKDLQTAVFAMEELEEAAKLAILTRGLGPTELTEAQIQSVVQKFDVDW